MTAPQVVPRLQPLAPWGVAVADVAALCTTVPIRDQVPDGARPSSTVDITVATVQMWIREVSNMVLGSIGPYERVIDERRTNIILQAAKTVTVNGVASYVVSAAFPDAAAPNTTSYGQVLWQRYKDGLASLTGLVAGWIEAGGDGIGPVDSDGQSSAAYQFRPPLFPDCHGVLMPTSLVIDFPGDGLVLVNRQLERFAVGMSNLTPAFEGMAQVFARDMKEQFDTEGKSASGGWVALNSAYAEQKQVKHPGKPILQATGALVESLTSTPLGVQRIGPQEMEIGTDVPYAIYHQTGTNRMPARPEIALNTEQRGELTKVLQEYLVRLMKGALV